MYDDLGCIGFEFDFFKCFYVEFGYYNCVYIEDVGVSCGKLKLDIFGIKKNVYNYF